MADRRVVKLRPVPQEPCRRREEPASVQGALRPEPAPYSIRWCPRGRSERRFSLCECVPSSESASGEQCSTPRPAHAAGRRLSLVERRRESRARSVRPLRVGDGPSRFLGGKRWKKPETASIIARTTGRMEGFGRGNRPPEPTLLTAMRQLPVTGPGQRLVPPYAAGEDAAQPQPQQRPVPVHFGASQRLLASPDLLTPAFPVPGV